MYVCDNDSEEMVYYDDFKDETGFELINDFVSIKQPELKNGGVSMKDLRKISNSITNQIKEQVVLDA
jgi:hypothetical protein